MKTVVDKETYDFILKQFKETKGTSHTVIKADTYYYGKMITELYKIDPFNEHYAKLHKKYINEK